MDRFRSKFRYPEKATIDKSNPHSQLYEAIKSAGDIESFKQLLVLTAPNLDEVDIDNHLLRQTSFNNNSLHMAVQLSNSVSLVEEILNQCDSSKSLEMLMQQNMNGDTPLHVAARSRSKEIVSLFIDHARRDSQLIANQRSDEDHDNDVEKGISKDLQLLRTANNNNNTALHEALQYQTFSGIPHLLRSADPGFEYFANDSGETPLYLVVEHGTPALLEQMLEICPSQSYGAPGGRTALHALALLTHSSFKGKFSKSVYLLRHIVKEVDKNGRTAIHYAVHVNNIEFVDAVVKVNPSVCYVPDKDGMTPLHHAAATDAQYWDSKEIMKIMLQHCPDCWEVLDNQGRNFLHVAACNNNTDVLKYVLDEISSDLAVDTIIRKKDKNRQTPCEICDDYFESFESSTRMERIDLFGINFTLHENVQNKQGEKDRKAAEKTKDEKKTENKERKKMIREHMESYNETLLVVSALIATVAFAANFTLPGGYNSEAPHKGMAVLAHKPSFIAFIVSNSLAMVLSSLAILIQFVGKMVSIASDNPEDRSGKLLLMMILCNLLAILAMMVAFVTGTYTVLSHLPGLALPICVLGCIFFFLTFYVIYKLLKLVRGDYQRGR